MVELQHNRLQKIDLEPLSRCQNLQRLALSSNQLERIDLSPLAKCTKLENLDLGANRLSNITLDPLTHCLKLNRLSISNNELQRVDFQPLCKSRHSSLRSINLFDNPWQSLDLAVLAGCADELLVEPTTDESSWLRFYSSARGFYERPSQVYPWFVLHRVLRQHWRGWNRRLQHDMLTALGLGDYGFIDADLHKVLLSFSPEMSSDEVRSELVPLIVKAIAGGHSTTGLNLDVVAGRHGEIAIRAQEIVEAREQEQRSVHVGVKDGLVNLSELYVTAYGFDVLSSLKMRLTTDLNGFQHIIPEPGNPDIRENGCSLCGCRARYPRQYRHIHSKLSCAQGTTGCRIREAARGRPLCRDAKNEDLSE